MFKKTIDGIEFKEIAVDQIITSEEDNPRLSVNEARDSLKRSISTTLAKHVVLEVSQRPGLESYVLFRGGNTRLEVLVELRDEWDRGPENPYSNVKCMVFPWDEEEKTILTATENMVRGDLCYAEQARAVNMLKSQYETGDHSISFEEWAGNLGISMKTSSVSISRYLNTDTHITPYMPQLMVKGKAKQAVAIFLLNIRWSVYKVLLKRYCFEAGIDETALSNNRKQADFLRERSERERDKITEAVFQKCDDETLKKDRINQRLVDEIQEETGTISLEERVLFVPEKSPLVVKFAKKYKLYGDSPDELGDDKMRNAALLLLDTLTDDVGLTANRRTRVLKKLNVSNDLSGFMQLAGHLDATGRQLLTRIMKDV